MKQADPDLETFGALTRRAYEALPAEFRALCGDIVIHVADLAEKDILVDLGIPEAMMLTGLFEGVDLTRQSITDPSSGNHVHLYRLPILAELKESDGVTLEELITHVLVHEIGHHFGLSDDDMHRIEDQAD